MNYFVPLISLFILSVGTGFFSSLIPVRLNFEHVSASIIGLNGAAFYLGLVIGSFHIEQYIIRVGHIRSYAAFASLIAVISLIQGIIVDPLLWVVLRFVAGIGMGALYIVIESWLLVCSNATNRGKLLAFYMLSLYGAQSLGQLLLNLKDLQSLLPFALIAISCSLSVIPLALSRAPAPIFDEPSALGMFKLFKIAASGVVGCLISGCILGAVYSLLPLYFSQTGATPGQISYLMAVMIFGGMSLQYPIGKLSDLFERRLILQLICLCTILVTLSLLFFQHSQLTLLIATFFFGGLIFTIYPVSVSYACDALDSKDIIAGTQGLLISYSVGATSGPLVASFMIYFFQNSGLLFYIIICCLFYILFLLWRKLSYEAPKHEDKFRAISQTTPVLSELDPRAED